MKVFSGGEQIQDTSSQKYKTQAKNTLNLTTVKEEHKAELRQALEAQKSDAAKTQEQLTNLSAEHTGLKSQLKQQQQAQLEQTNTERSHRFTSNANSVQDLINREIIKLSKTDNSNLEQELRETTNSKEILDRISNDSPFLLIDRDI
jgi:hypothetical protein